MTKKLKLYFIPHEANDHRPHLLRPRMVLFVCLVAIMMETAFLVGSSFIIPRVRLFGVIVVNALVDGTNEARITAGVPALHENALLDAAAEEKVNDMVTNNYFAHTSPSGTTPWYWFWNAGYNFSSAGENLAVDFTDSMDVTTAWLNSAEHRANIMNASYTDIGMATVEGTYDGHPATYVVELFGAPAVPYAAAAAQSPAGSATGAAAKTVAVAKTAAPAAGLAPAAAVKPVVKTVSPTAVSAVASFPVVAGASATTPAAAPVVPAVAPAVPAPQTTFAQSLAADPRRTVDYIYLVIALVFAVALVLNIFMKAHIQHPQVILGGMLVILVVGLLVVFNQHFGLPGAVVL